MVQLTKGTMAMLEAEMNRSRLGIRANVQDAVLKEEMAQKSTFEKLKSKGII